MLYAMQVTFLVCSWMKLYMSQTEAKTSNYLTLNLYYAAPRVASIALFAPINIVQGIYAIHYGLALTTIASVILIVRMFDAITDPVIGYLSDRSRFKHGTRKPYMVAGALLTVISGYFLYTPPENVSVFYFGIWFMAFYLGFTLFEIPHLAWGGEISHSSHEKINTYTFRSAAGFSGLVFFYSLPLLPIWETSEISPDTLKFSAIASGLLMLPLLYFCMKRVPDGSCYSEKNKIISVKKYPANIDKNKYAALSETIKSVVFNTPLLLFLAAFVFAGMGLGMWYGMIFIFFDAYLGVGELFAQISLIAVVVAILSSLAWIKIAKFIGKRLAWVSGMVLGITAFIYTGFLTPENVSYLSLLILLSINMFCFSCLEAIPQSMLSDIVDYGTLKFHVYRGGTYFSLFLFVYKAAFALGGAVGLGVAGWYGFEPSAHSHTTGSVLGLMLTMTWIPGFLVVISIVFIYLAPVSANRHRIIHRRLESLDARLNI